MGVRMRRLGRWWTFGLVSAGLLMAIVAGFLVFAHVEENDAFCASCHSQPEVTYVQRAASAGAVDLASAHARLAQDHANAVDTRCIDCHAGPGLVGRLGAMSQGARDAVRWFSGTSRQPALMTVPIADANCLKCHADVPSVAGFDSHFHRHLARWQQVDAAAATCASCHTSHTTDGNANIGFLQQQRTLILCNQCHTALKVK